MSDLKVVYLIGQLGRGGSERQLYLLLSNMPQVDRHVLVFNPHEHPIYKRDFQAIGVTVTDLPATARSKYTRVKFIAAYLRRLQPDVVHSWTFHDNAYAWLAGLLAGVPVRLGSLRRSLDSPIASGLSKPLRYACIKGPSHIVVNWREGIGELEARGLNSKRAFLLTNCVATSESETPADLSPLGIHPDHRVIGAVGNLHYNKNHPLLVAALADVLPKYPDVRALIVGKPNHAEPQLENQLKAQIEASGLKGKVVLAGFRDDVPSVMCHLDVFCLTSRVEGTPNVVLEAMAAARPVVATAVNGVPDIVKDGVTGILVPSEDRTAVAKALDHLLTSPETARKMGLAGRERIGTEFSCSAAAERLLDFYRQLL